MFSIAMAIMICGINIGSGSSRFTPEGAVKRIRNAIWCDLIYLALIMLFIALRDAS